MAKPVPELTDKLLARELVTVTNWFPLGKQLGLEHWELKKIEADYSGIERRKEEMFYLWMRHETEHSWEKVIEALESTKERDLVADLRERYIQRRPEPVTSSGSSGSEQHKGATEATATEGTTIRKRLKWEDKVLRIFRKVEGEFNSLVVKIQSALEKVPLIELKISCKRYLNQKPALDGVKDVRELFDVLDPYYDFLNPSLLEGIVSIHLKDHPIQKQVVKYCKHLKDLKKSTALKKLLKEFEAQSPPTSPDKPPNTCTVVIELAGVWAPKTLENLENLMNILFKERSSVLTNCEVVPGSVVVTYLAPQLEAEPLIAQAKEQVSFMPQVGVCKLSVAGTVVFHEPSGMSTFTFEASLLKAVVKNDTHLMSFLLNLNTDPNVLINDPTPDIDTTASSLFVASHLGHCEAIRLLLEHKASVNLLTGDGRTPLMTASSHNQLDAVDLLVKKGADLEILDKDYDTALRYANDHHYYQVVELLLKAGANPNVVGSDGWSCLLIACADNFHENVDLLLKHGADPTHATSHGKSCLMMASQSGHIESLTSVLKFVPIEEINRQMEGGWSALSLAYDHPEAAELLLEKGADPNIPLKDGWTTLMLACQEKCQPKTVDALLSHKADPNQGSTLGVTPYGLAKQHGHYQLMETLQKAGAKPNPTVVTSPVSTNKPKPEYPQKRKYKIGKALWEAVRRGGQELLSQIKKSVKTIY